MRLAAPHNIPGGPHLIEVVFTESAAGSMQEAKVLGEKGLSGSPKDIYCFPLHLDIGPIAGGVMGDERRKVLEKLFSAYPFWAAGAAETISAAKDTMERFTERVSKDEPIRIWYSSEPDEYCGYLWICSVLQDMPLRGPVELVCLPHWEKMPGGTIVFHTGFGELAPEEFAPLEETARQAPDLLIAGNQFEWMDLAGENAGLRAVISGRVMSVPDSFYDFLILRELEGMEDEFPEALLIGTVLGRSQIGMSDAFLARRIQTMVDAGLLEVVRPCDDPEVPTYHRTVRKKTLPA